MWDKSKGGVCFWVVLWTTAGRERLLGLLLLPWPQRMSLGETAAPENLLISSLDLRMAVQLAFQSGHVEC